MCEGTIEVFAPKLVSQSTNCLVGYYIRDAGELNVERADR